MLTYVLILCAGVVMAMGRKQRGMLKPVVVVVVAAAAAVFLAVV